MGKKKVGNSFRYHGNRKEVKKWLFTKEVRKYRSFEHILERRKEDRLL